MGIHVSALLAECNQARFKVVAVSAVAWDQRSWGGGASERLVVFQILCCTYFVHSELRVGRSPKFIFAVGKEMP